jgi:predicted secreted protein|tara:strand:+ start:650 stop:835 length:186 start_codon:yes stop_codon:yes gene_type:complete
MNQKTARRIRKICNPVDEVSKRVYRRLKQQYKKLPNHAKANFLDLIEQNFSEIGKILLEQK